MTDDKIQRLLVKCNRDIPQTVDFVLQSPLQDVANMISGEVSQTKHLAPRPQCGDDFKRRVFCGGTDEADGPVLDIGQNGVLLGFVEAMDFVDEQNCLALGLRPTAFGALDDFPDVRDTGIDGADLVKLALGDVRHDTGDGGFAGSRRSP
jgi:hypothetical protein